MFVVHSVPFVPGSFFLGDCPQRPASSCNTRPMIEKVTLPVSISRDWSVHCRSSDKSASLDIDSRKTEKRSYNIIVQGVKETQNIFSAHKNGDPNY